MISFLGQALLHISCTLSMHKMSVAELAKAGEGVRGAKAACTWFANKFVTHFSSY